MPCCMKGALAGEGKLGIPETSKGRSSQFSKDQKKLRGKDRGRRKCAAWRNPVSIGKSGARVSKGRGRGGRGFPNPKKTSSRGGGRGLPGRTTRRESSRKGGGAGSVTEANQEGGGSGRGILLNQKRFLRGHRAKKPVGLVQAGPGSAKGKIRIKEKEKAARN